MYYYCTSCCYPRLLYFLTVITFTSHTKSHDPAPDSHQPPNHTPLLATPTPDSNIESPASLEDYKDRERDLNIEEMGGEEVPLTSSNNDEQISSSEELKNLEDPASSGAESSGTPPIDTAANPEGLVPETGGGDTSAEEEGNEGGEGVVLEDCAVNGTNYTTTGDGGVGNLTSWANISREGLEERGGEEIDDILTFEEFKNKMSVDAATKQTQGAS